MQTENAEENLGDTLPGDAETGDYIAEIDRVIEAHKIRALRLNDYHFRTTPIQSEHPRELRSDHYESRKTLISIRVDCIFLVKQWREGAFAKEHNNVFTSAELGNAIELHEYLRADMKREKTARAEAKKIVDAIVPEHARLKSEKRRILGDLLHECSMWEFVIANNIHLIVADQTTETEPPPRKRLSSFASFSRVEECFFATTFICFGAKPNTEDQNQEVLQNKDSRFYLSTFARIVYFQDAVLSLELTGCCFRGDIIAHNCHFGGNADPMQRGAMIRANVFFGAAQFLECHFNAGDISYNLFLGYTQFLLCRFDVHTEMKKLTFADDSVLLTERYRNDWYATFYYHTVLSEAPLGPSLPLREFIRDEHDPNQNLTFDSCEFEGLLDFSESHAEAEVIFAGNKFRKSTDRRYSAWRIAQLLDFKKSNFAGGLIWGKNEIDLDVDFSNSSFGFQTLFIEQQFPKKTPFVDCTFSELTLKDTEFQKDVSFFQTIYEWEARFQRTTFHGEALFSDARFGNVAEFSSCAFQSSIFHKAEFCHTASFYQSSFHKSCLFRKAKFRGDTYLTEALFAMSLVLDEAEFSHRVVFTGSSFSKGISMRNAQTEQTPNLLGTTTDSPIDLWGVTIHDPYEINNLSNGLQKEKSIFGEIASKFRRLKQLSEDAKNYHLAQDFLVSELQSQALSRNSRFAPLSLAMEAYGVWSDYGRNFWLPLLWLMVVVLGAGGYFVSDSKEVLLIAPLLFIGALLYRRTASPSPYDQQSLLGSVGIGALANLSILVSLSFNGKNALAGLSFAVSHAFGLSKIPRLYPDLLMPIRRELVHPYSGCAPGDKPCIITANEAVFALLVTNSLFVMGIFSLFLFGLSLRNYLRLR